MALPSRGTTTYGTNANASSVCSCLNVRHAGSSYLCGMLIRSLALLVSSQAPRCCRAER